MSQQGTLVSESAVGPRRARRQDQWIEVGGGLPLPHREQQSTPCAQSTGSQEWILRPNMQTFLAGGLHPFLLSGLPYHA